MRWLLLLLFSICFSPACLAQTVFKGALIRGDSSQKKIAIVFTADEFGEGGWSVLRALKREKVKASFFLTGRFYRHPSFEGLVRQLKKEGHYLGAHSDQHLLYCDWSNRDSLLVSENEFREDLDKNYAELNRFGLSKKKARYFLPPYEWYNDSIAAWTKKAGLRLVNYTPGTLSHADYTTPADKNYRSSATIYESILDYERKHRTGLNGFILLMHIGTDEKRTDKFYRRLPSLIQWLKAEGYQLVRIDALPGS